MHRKEARPWRGLPREADDARPGAGPDPGAVAAPGAMDEVGCAGVADGPSTSNGPGDHSPSLRSGVGIAPTRN